MDDTRPVVLDRVFTTDAELRRAELAALPRELHGAATRRPYVPPVEPYRPPPRPDAPELPGQMGFLP